MNASSRLSFPALISAAIDSYCSSRNTHSHILNKFSLFCFNGSMSTYITAIDLNRHRWRLSVFFFFGGGRAGGGGIVGMHEESIEPHFLHFNIISGRYKDTSCRSLELTLKLLTRTPHERLSAFPSTPISRGDQRPPAALPHRAGPRHFPPAPGLGRARGALSQPRPPCLPAQGCAPSLQPAFRLRSLLSRRCRARLCTAPVPPGRAGRADATGAAAIRHLL